MIKTIPAPARSALPPVHPMIPNSTIVRKQRPQTTDGPVMPYRKILQIKPHRLAMPPVITRSLNIFSLMSTQKLSPKYSISFVP